MVANHETNKAFTLVELSVVLVIIGLIVGSVLLGRDLIASASVRSQVSQIEKYNQAVNTFYVKFGYYPGDIPDPAATQIGLIARVANQPGRGDGNGLIQGSTSWGNYNTGHAVVSGETAVAWRDLSTTNLIDQGLRTSDFTTNFYPQSTDPGLILPDAVIGRNNYIYINSGGPRDTDRKMYFSLSSFTTLNTSNWTVTTTPGLTVLEAYSIDSKIDDGLPQSGRVQAFYFNSALQTSFMTWAAGGGVEGANTSHLASTASTAASSTTCYDNASTVGSVQQYSVGQSGGNGINCALSFRFQ